MVSEHLEPAGIIKDSLQTFGHFVRDAARVLAQHWPQLISLFLIGWIGRMTFLWIATVVSDWNPTIAVLILPLAPLCTLLSFVLMMRAMAPTLPAFSGLVEQKSPVQRWTDDFAAAGQVMIPFLAVYASAGLLKQDTAVFLIDSATDESLNTAISQMDFGRADYAPGMTILAFIVVALVLRKLISILNLGEKRLAWAAFAAYLEVLWIMTLAQALSSQISTLQDWVTSRKLIADVINWYEATLAAIREWSSAVGAIIDAVGTTVSSLGSVIAVPVAWLAIGASVYGYQLQSSKLKVPGHEQMSTRIKRIPNPVRRAAEHVVEPVVTPIQGAVTAIGRVAAAGIVPMVMFCVAFVVASGLQSLAALAMRALIGPSSLARIYALEPYATMVERGVYFVIVLSLLAAAVNAVVMAQERRNAETSA